MSTVLRVIIEGENRTVRMFEEVKTGAQGLVGTIGQVSAKTVRVGEVGEASFNSLARGVWTATRLFGFMEMSFMRVEVAQSILTSAQERYTYALEKHGAGSREAWLAQQELERVTNYVSRANIRAALSAGSFAVQVILETGVLKVATLATVAKTVSSYGAAAGQWFHNHALAVGIVLAATFTGGAWALAAALGAAAGASALAAAGIANTGEEAEKAKQLVGESPSTGLVKGIEDLGAVARITALNLGGFTLNLSRESGNFEDEWENAGRRVKRELKRIG